MTSEKVPQKKIKSSKRKKSEKKKKSSQGKRRVKDDYKNLRPGYVLRSKSDKLYTLIRVIGEGGMGAVYEAEERESKQRLAIKCERERKYKKFRVIKEKAVYRRVKSDHFPKYMDCGIEENFGWIAMQLVGATLRTKQREAPDRKFSVATTCKIAIQILDGLQALHKKGYVHRDLKPENLAVGLGHLSKKIIIIDTGISRQTLNKNGMRKRPRTKINFKGTRTFAPIAMHKRVEYGPKDDLETLIYLMASFMTGLLPWARITQRDKDAELIKAKQEALKNPKLIFVESRESGALYNFVRYVANLHYEDPIDYSYVRRLLNSTGSEATRFDWELGITQMTTTEG